MSATHQALNLPWSKTYEFIKVVLFRSRCRNRREVKAHIRQKTTYTKNTTADCWVFWLQWYRIACSTTWY